MIATLAWGFAAASLSAAAAIVAWTLSVQPRRAREAGRRSLSAVSAAVEARTGREGDTAAILVLVGSVAAKMNLAAEERLNLEMSAHLCDIGMTAVPYAFLNGKPVSKPGAGKDAAFGHAEEGAGMIERVEELRPLTQIVRCHHAPFEGHDGTGLPTAEDIPVEARILCAVSAYVETVRLNGRLLAVDALKWGNRREFCPVVVDALLGVLRSDRD
ncbi:MAG: hypothetical protein IH851_08445 [Armatimonadetes bacterium]|nr:hypothetical protein [Armatimonadota bacterium]